MLPHDLKPEGFVRYPPQARALLVSHLPALQQLPLSFLPSLLREAIDYDYKFPAERASIDKELANLSALTPAQLGEWFQAFSQITLSQDMENLDWLNQPGQYVDRLSAYLWTTHQLDSFRAAATAYGDRLRKVEDQAKALPTRRIGIAVVGGGIAEWDQPLFRKLRPHGAYFAHVKPENGLDLLLAGIAKRATAHPGPYAHWYIDGGVPANHDAQLTCVSYQTLEPARAALLRNIQAEIRKPGMGPEELRAHLTQLVPADLGLQTADDEVLGRFQVKLLTEGSGTQIFSTTFVQWSAREAQRRAQPLTLMTRFAPRQRQKTMNELLADTGSNADLDLPGSLVDADMAAYYQWINQQRLPGAEKSGFLVWFEGHKQALAIGPSVPRGTESTTVADLGELLDLVAA